LIFKKVANKTIRASYSTPTLVSKNFMQRQRINNGSVLFDARIVLF